MIYISFFLIVLSLILIILKTILRYLNKNFPLKLNTTNFNPCILIPARDESNVIENLLISIKNQTYNISFKNVYVIIEDKKDKTYNICKKYDANVFIRKKTKLKRKGYALQEVIENITKSKNYDAYFIMDADNILDKNFIKEMQNTYFKGYDLVIGKRKIKNKTNSISISSGLIFTIINDVLNKSKSKHSVNCDVSGTGFYISGKIINDLKTFPFHSLTEDYELSLFLTLNNYKTYYNEKAIFYDEQPITYRDYFKQRTRWIKGYFEARKNYSKLLLKKLRYSNKNFASIFESLVGVYDIILMIIGIFLYILNLLISKNLLTIVITLVAVIYIILIVFTIYLLKIENEKICFSLKIKTLFMHPLLLLTYIPSAIKALFTKELNWDKITHGN